LAASNGAARLTIGRQEVFFFEKKKQKTFTILPSAPTDKSFLVLFFKKELLP
jgi:hypothetical protein